MTKLKEASSESSSSTSEHSLVEELKSSILQQLKLNVIATIFCEEQNIFTKSDIDEIDQFGASTIKQVKQKVKPIIGYMHLESKLVCGNRFMRKVLWG